MSYTSLAALASDGDFRQRVAACAAEQETQADADLGGLHPTAWADQHLWQIAAAPGFADNPDIRDQQILAAVQAELARDADADT